MKSGDFYLRESNPGFFLLLTLPLYIISISSVAEWFNNQVSTAESQVRLQEITSPDFIIIDIALADNPTTSLMCISCGISTGDLGGASPL